MREWLVSGDTTGAVEATTGIQAAIDAANAAGGGVLRLPAGILLSGQLTWKSGVVLSGLGSASVLKAKNALNAPLIVGTSLTDVGFADFKIDGNKANQTDNSEGAGIKMITSTRGFVEHVHIDSTEGHAFHISSVSTTNEGWRFENCLATNIGTAGNATYGSAFVTTEAEHITYVGCQAFDIAKAGFRTSGSAHLAACVAERCANGGIVTVSGEAASITVDGGSFSNCGTSSDNDGIRLLGTDRAVFDNVLCEGNYGSGLHIGNGCDFVAVRGGIFRNNGQHGSAAGANEGRSGISIGGDGTAITSVVIANAILCDTQGSPTQDYGLDIRDTVTGLLIHGCVFSGNQLGEIRRAFTTASTGIVIDPPGVPTTDARSSFTIRDDFLNGSTTSQTIGEQRWYLSGVGVTAAQQAAEQHHPGIYRIDTGSTINTVGSFRLGGGNTHVIDADNYFDMLWIVRPGQIDANTQIRIGLSSDSVGDAPSNGVYLERLGTDTNWFGVGRSGGSQSRADTGVAAAAGWHALRARRVSSTVVAFSVDGAAEVLVSSNVPTSSLCVMFQLKTLTGAAKTMDVDFFELSAAGLIR